MRNLKRLIAVISILALAVSLVACGAAQQTDTNESKTDSQPTAAATKGTPEPVTLSTLMFTQYFNDAGFQAVLKDLTAETGITLDITQVPDGEQGNTIFRTRFATNDYPDLMFYYAGSLVAKETGDPAEHFVDQSNADWTKNYDKKAWDLSQSVNGTYYAAPYRGALVLGVIYNKKMFSEQGLEAPKNYDEFMAACEKFKSAGKTAFYISGKDGWTTMLLPWLGGSYGYTEDYVSQINTNKVSLKENLMQKEALVKLLEIKENGYINSNYMSDGWDNAQTALANGEAAMYINLSNTLDEISKKYPDKVADLGMFAFPFKGNGEDIVGVTGTSGIYAIKGKNEEAAMRFINYFQSIPIQNKFFGAQGGIPAIKGVTETKLTPGELDGKALVDAGKAYPMWSTGLKYAFGDYGALCQDLIIGAKTPDQVLESVDNEFKKNAKSQADENFK